MVKKEQWWDCPHCGLRVSDRAKQAIIEFKIKNHLTCNICNLTTIEEFVSRILVVTDKEVIERSGEK